jgi:hypothetical protein
MKTKSLLAMAVAPMILGMPLAAMAESVTTDPVGFVKTSLTAGTFTPVGLNLNKPSVFAAGVSSSDATTISVDGSHDFASLLPAGSYYVEITGGGLSGDRIDVNVASTVGGNSVIHLNVNSGNNTVTSAAALSAGDTFVIRPHITFGDVTAMIGAANLFTADEVEDTDQILLYEGNAFRIYAHFDGDWFDASDFSAVNSKVIAPGVGMLFRRQGPTSVELTALGEVRSNDFVLPLSAGLQLVTFGFPVDRSPSDYSFTTDFFTGAVADVEEGDQILLYANNGFQIHALFDDNNWYAAGDFSEVTNSNLFEAGNSVLIKRFTADPDFRINLPY